MTIKRTQLNTNNMIIGSASSQAIETLNGQFMAFSSMTTQISATESITDIPIPIRCTAIRISVKISTNTSGNISTFTLRINTGSTTLIITVGAGLTGVFSATGSIAIALGDLINMLFTHVTDATSIIIRGQSIGLRV